MKNIKKLESSIGVRLEKLYQKIDTRIAEHYKNSNKKPPCRKGCSNCCYQFFEISDFEFMYILEGLSKVDNDTLNQILNRVMYLWNQFNSLYPELSKQYSVSVEIKDPQYLFDYYNNPLRGKINLPCIFLDPNDGGCLIYEYRPLVCHTHGVSYERTDLKGRTCNKIWFAGLARRWQADLRDLYDEIMSFEILKSEKFKNNKYYQDIILRKYPILYHMYIAFFVEKSGLNPPNRCMYYEIPESLFLDTYHQAVIKKKKELND
ncbi:YkgJ family cysteine cluster protein [Clostridium botulinum]|uniref:YkgJ family cysteine cluster protein n=1 Tax=Clostridium botulinum TaxID=1491 RepID=UPI000773E95D|nr:YkgJ family cysteine cluster protein [Clostridium botulinum]NFL87368.1 YkgJ family cysteine cluster protein [Clostridium botulinum]NFO21705.1 YkgJ family cysteine cluster protein [Clostridium botulinum]